MRISHWSSDVCSSDLRQAVAVLQVDVEGVLHRPRRMVQRIVQRGEVGPVVLDFGAVGHIETDRTEDFFDAFPTAGNGLDDAWAQAAAGQGDVDRSEDHTSELQSQLHISYASFCMTQNNTSSIKNNE